MTNFQSKKAVNHFSRLRPYTQREMSIDNEATLLRLQADMKRMDAKLDAVVEVLQRGQGAAILREALQN